MDKISVIVPTRNRKAYLRSLIDNLRKQTHKNLELVIVDDHSTDGTYDWLSEERDNEIVVLQNTGRGPGSARNSGLEKATGDYIKFFDSDDLMTSNSLEIQLQVLKSSDKGFIYSPFFMGEEVNGRWFSRDHVIIHYYPFSETRSLAQWMCRGLFIAIPSMLFRREFIKGIGSWRTDVASYEDWDYLWRLARLESRPVHTNECAFIYRQHHNQTTVGNMTGTERDLEGFRVLENEFQEALRENIFNSMDKLFLENRVYRIAAKLNGATGRPEEAESFLNFKNRLFDEYIRIYLKAGRIRTGTDYMPFYGVLKSVEKIARYLNFV